MTLIKYDDEHVVIAFDNSNNELEYTIYKAIDGGTTDMFSSWQDPRSSRYDDLADTFNSVISMNDLNIESELQELDE